MPEHDVVVVGGGFAGMRAAIAAKSAGVDVALVSKVYPLRSHSSGTHSSINAALGADDSWETHAQDTIVAGDYLGDQDAVQVLCQEGIEDVIQLEHMGVIFSRNEQGRIDVMPFGGSSKPRSCYVGDSAGHIILQVLYEQLLRLQIPTYDEWFVTTLMMDEGVCRGVIAQELLSGQLHALHSKAIVLATGGIGRMYEPTTSAYTSTADGVALAYRAGAPLMDMEMVQYHPTTLADRGVVITEASRGEGAYLINTDGDRFMAGYLADQMDLAPRHLCCQAIESEIAAGRGVDGHVFLDFRHLDKKRIADRLPETQLLVKRLADIDLTEELVPVRPAMHRPLGGIQVDIQGATAIPGLYAAGECASVGVHGADGLGGNALLDCVVFGRRAGEAAASHAKSGSFKKTSESLLADVKARVEEMSGREPGADTVGSLRRELASTMDQAVGLSRNAEGLRQAGDTISELRKRCSKVAIPNAGGAYNLSLSSLLELENMLDVAQVIVAGALAREESRGFHRRSDFSQRNDENWLQHTVVSHTADGPELSYKPVVITQWKP